MQGSTLYIAMCSELGYDEQWHSHCRDIYVGQLMVSVGVGVNEFNSLSNSDVDTCGIHVYGLVGSKDSGSQGISNRRRLAPCLIRARSFGRNSKPS